MRQVAIGLPLTLWLAACGAPAGGSGFQVETLDGRLDGQHLTASADLNLVLSEAARQALRRGVAITIRVQARIRHPQTWLPWNLSEAEDAWELRYQPLSEHYTLIDLSDASQESFPRLRHLISELEQARLRLSLDKLEAGEYALQLRVVLDVHRLPTPMRLPALIESQWQLSSEWRTWPFQVAG